MSFAVDANVLLYASDSDSPFHEPAASALASLAGASELMYVFWPVAMAYVRIATHPSVFDRPLAPREAIDNLDGLLSRPNVRAPGEDDGFWAEFRAVAEPANVRGNLVPDAHLVALMRQHGVRTIVSHDRDFRRFDDIRLHDPLV